MPHVHELYRACANIVGSDLAPKLTPIGSPATLFWLDRLERCDMHIGWGYYLSMGLLLTVPVLVVTLTGPWTVTGAGGLSFRPAECEFPTRRDRRSWIAASVFLKRFPNHATFLMVDALILKCSKTRWQFMAALSLNDGVGPGIRSGMMPKTSPGRQ